METVCGALLTSESSYFQDTMSSLERFMQLYYPDYKTTSFSEVNGFNQQPSPVVPKLEDATNTTSNSSFKETLHLLFAAKNRIEEPLLLARKQLVAIKSTKSINPITLSKVTNYATRIGGSVAAPPETHNIADPVMHHSLYPNYHFLNIVSHEEMLRSRLWDIASWGNVCFPPMIMVEKWANSTYSNSVRMRLTCSTPGATLVFQINDGPPVTYNPSKNFILNGPKELKISAFGKKEGYRTSRISYRIIRFATAAAVFSSNALVSAETLSSDIKNTGNNYTSFPANRGSTIDANFPGTRPGLATNYGLFSRDN